MTAKTTNMKLAAAIIAILLIGAASAFAFSFGKYEDVKPTGGVVSIPLTDVDDGKAQYFRFADGGKEIAFIVVKASDGSYRTAFDACDACFRAKKGYEQKGTVLVCKNCNQKFAIGRIGPHAVGGCNPSYLPSQVKGKNITITTQDLKLGARYF